MPESRRFVIGDIHGCVKTFRKMLDDKLIVTKQDKIYLLGDYIDRGPDSKMMLDELMMMQKQSFNIFPLMGNHEYMMLQALESDIYFELWQANGCGATLLSFGIPPGELDNPGSVRMIPERYFTFLNSLQYYIMLDDFFLVHAGLGEVYDDPMEDIDSLLWTRVEIYDTDLLKGRRIIHGHTPKLLHFIEERIKNPKSKIYNLDAGCVYRHNPGMGNLAALNMDTMELFIQENIDG